MPREHHVQDDAVTPDPPDELERLQEVLGRVHHTACRRQDLGERPGKNRSAAAKPMVVSGSLESAAMPSIGGSPFGQRMRSSQHYGLGVVHTIVDPASVPRGNCSPQCHSDLTS